MTLHIDVISDIVCPWCYIGKRKLERALELYRERTSDAAPPEVSWHPFQLNPDLPEGGIERAEYLRRKFGGHSTQVYARVSAVGAQVGIPFAFDKIAWQPNTLGPHSLIMLAGASGLQSGLVEGLFRGYFIDGRDLNANEVLTDIACAAGLGRPQVEAYLASAQVREHVRSEDARARSLGVEGVPFFVFNRRYAVSGAQDPEVLVDAMLTSERQPGPAEEN